MSQIIRNSNSHTSDQVHRTGFPNQLTVERNVFENANRWLLRQIIIRFII